MQLIIFLVCILIFLFFIYRLGRDDYVFIRKNISMEQLFDLAFVGLIGGIIFTQCLFIVFHRGKINLFLQFFSPTISDLSLSGVAIGGLFCIYFVGRYKRFPLSRIFDFFSLAFLAVLPIGFFGSLVLLRRKEFFLDFFSGLLYLILAIFFFKFLYYRLMNGKLREGSLSTLFLLVFSLLSLFTSLISVFSGKFIFFRPEDYFLIGVFLLSLFLLFRQRKQFAKGKK